MSNGIDLNHFWRLAKVQAYLRSRLMFPPFARQRRKDWASREHIRIFISYTVNLGAKPNG